MKRAEPGKDWIRSADGKSIRAEYVMRDFAAAIDLIGRIARLAEENDHHPDLHLTNYRKLAVELTTHSCGGLSQKDDLLACLIDGLAKDLKR